MTNNIKFLVISALFMLNFLAIPTNAQTTLTAGDIAFSGYIGNGASAAVDEFSFVLLKNVSSGTVINFTDNGWLSTNVFRTGEQNITWTTNSALAVGQEIKISGNDTDACLRSRNAGRCNRHSTSAVR